MILEVLRNALIKLLEVYGLIRVIIIMTLILSYLIFPDLNGLILNTVLEFFSIPYINNIS